MKGDEDTVVVITPGEAEAPVTGDGEAHVFAHDASVTSALLRMMITNSIVVGALLLLAAIGSFVGAFFVPFNPLLWISGAAATGRVVFCFKGWRRKRHLQQYFRRYPTLKGDVHIVDGTIVYQNQQPHNYFRRYPSLKGDILSVDGTIVYQEQQPHNKSRNPVKPIWIPGQWFRDLPHLPPVYKEVKIPIQNIIKIEVQDVMTLVRYKNKNVKRFPYIKWLLKPMEGKKQVFIEYHLLLLEEGEQEVQQSTNESGDTPTTPIITKAKFHIRDPHEFRQVVECFIRTEERLKEVSCLASLGVLA